MERNSEVGEMGNERKKEKIAFLTLWGLTAIVTAIVTVSLSRVTLAENVPQGYRPPRLCFAIVTLSQSRGTIAERVPSPKTSLLSSGTPSILKGTKNNKFLTQNHNLESTKAHRVTFTRRKLRVLQFGTWDGTRQNWTKKLLSHAW